MIEGAHTWFRHLKFKPLVTCKKCGVVRWASGNKPCPGKTRPELRDNRIKENAND